MTSSDTSKEIGLLGKTVSSITMTAMGLEAIAKLESIALLTEEKKSDKLLLDDLVLLEASINEVFNRYVQIYREKNPGKIV